jgi:alpha-galactosidase
MGKSGLLIDNCASGGRRIDYETCKRSVPLWRTDYNCEPHPDVYDASQNHTFGLGLYLPYQSVGQTITYDKYKDRSLTSTSVVLTISPTKADELVQVPFDKVKSVWDDVKSYNYLMAYDFYPLTNFSMADNVWMVFQYDHPEKGEGCVICYRRKNAPFTAAVFDLRAIDEQATYKLIDIDNRTEEYVKGSELARFTVQLQPLESRVFKYLKIRS